MIGPLLYVWKQYYTKGKGRNATTVDHFFAFILIHTLYIICSILSYKHLKKHVKIYIFLTLNGLFFFQNTTYSISHFSLWPQTLCFSSLCILCLINIFFSVYHVMIMTYTDMVTMTSTKVNKERYTATTKTICLWVKASYFFFCYVYTSLVA